MNYIPWFLKDLKKKDGAPTVFSCFHCGGGSTMGYKLAGFNVLGGVDIDPKMMELYRKNHNPKHSYLMGVQEFKDIPNDELPAELFSLDILDGSPPCSSFSISGYREEKWGVKKKFREGQAEQVLDELFFDFIDIAKKLKPKIVVAENVSGIIKGNAKFYVKRIHEAFTAAGYDLQLFLLDASFMNVPQKRERTFFIARRKDMDLNRIKLEFNYPQITFDKVKCGSVGKKICPAHMKLWEVRKEGDQDLGACAVRLNGKESNWNHKFLINGRVAKTIASSNRPILFDEPREANDFEIIRIQTFPEDYDFMKQDPGYVCGMSVPPRMMENVAKEIKRQWLSKTKIKKKL